MGDWIDALDKFTPAEISGACKAWVTDNPGKKPNFGHIAALIQKRRGRIVALHRSRDKSQQIQEADCNTQPRITPERRAEIMAEVGLSHDRSYDIVREASARRAVAINRMGDA